MRTFKKYVGDGSGFPDVPARDLSAAEFDALPANLQGAVIDSPLYRDFSAEELAAIGAQAGDN